MVQIRNVPEELHRTLKARAAMAGMSLSDYLLVEMRRLARRPSREELRRRLASRSTVLATESVAEALAAERRAR